MTFSGRRVVVMGLGRFGGGVGATRWLCGQGARVLVTDLGEPASLAESLEAIDDLVRAGRVDLSLGEHRVSDFEAADVVVVNPGVPAARENAHLAAARRAGAEVTTEIRLLVERLPDRRRVVGVTGSAGKSTTASMIAHALRRLDRAAGGSREVWLGGNIGGSLLPDLERITPTDLVVLELSSAMLHWLRPGAGGADKSGWSPGLAIATNLEPNHLDWHGTFAAYRDAKAQIFASQQEMEGDEAIVGDEACANAFEGSLRGRAKTASGVMPDDAMRNVRIAAPGAHNRDNARLALGATRRALERAGAHVSQETLAGALDDFRGLAHRLEVLEVDAGETRLFVNDSKATTPEASARAIEAVGEALRERARGGRIHLIAGGYDKGVSLAPIASSAAGGEAADGPAVAAVYAIGATAERLVEQVRARGGVAEPRRTLERAVVEAMRRMEAGDALLLSPGCASWDQFPHFQARGEAFREAVQRGLRDTEAIRKFTEHP